MPQCKCESAVTSSRYYVYVFLENEYPRTSLRKKETKQQERVHNKLF